MAHCLRMTYTGNTPIDTVDCITTFYNATGTPATNHIKHANTNTIKFLIASEDDLFACFKEPTFRKLTQASLTPVLTIEQKTKCSVLVRNVDSSVLSAPTTINLSQDISHRNAITVMEIYPVPNTKHLKIQCSSPTEAQKLLHHGIKILHTSTPPYLISPVDYLPLLQCFKCYKYSHETRKCKSPQICSKCSVEGHFYTQCSANTLKCINCQGGHSAVDKSCPLRKQTLKSLRNNQPRTQAHPHSSSSTSHNLSHHQTASATSMSYASVLNASPHQQHHHNTAQQTQSSPPLFPHPPPPPYSPLQNLAYERVTACVQAAYLKAKDDGRDFADYLPIFLTHNGLPSISVPPTQLLRSAPFSPTVLTPQNTMTSAEENTTVPPQSPTNPLLTATENGATDQTAHPGLSQTEASMSKALSTSSPNIVLSTSNLTTNTTTSDTSHPVPVNKPSVSLHPPTTSVISSVTHLVSSRARSATRCLTPTSRCKYPTIPTTILQDAPSSITAQLIESRNPHALVHAQNPTSTPSKPKNS